MVGAAAGVQTTVAQAAHLAGRCDTAAHGDDVLLARAIDALGCIAEVEFGGVALAYQAGAGEEVAVCTHGNLALANAAAQAVA